MWADARLFQNARFISYRDALPEDRPDDVFARRISQCVLAKARKFIVGRHRWPPVWLSVLPGNASAGGFGIRIDVGLPPPPPAPVVVVDYNTYCVGFRANLYDADWRLRNAQIEQWHAQEALDGRPSS